MSELAIELPCSFAQIGFADDIVAIENSARFVPADCHRNTFWDSAPHHVSHCRPTQIMKQQAWCFCLCADPCPGAAEIKNLRNIPHNSQRKS